MVCFQTWASFTHSNGSSQLCTNTSMTFWHESNEWILFVLMFSMKALAKHEKMGECNPTPCNRKLTQQQLKLDKRCTRPSYMIGSWKIFHITIRQSNVFDLTKPSWIFRIWEVFMITKCSKRQQENTVHASQNLDLMGEWQVVTSTYQTFPCALRAQDMPACNWNGTN